MGPWEAKMECKCPPEASKWTLQQLKLRDGASWAAKMELKSSQMRQHGPVGDFWTNLGCPKGTRNGTKLSTKNEAKWKPVMDTSWGPFLDRFWAPQRDQNSLKQGSEVT